MGEKEAQVFSIPEQRPATGNDLLANPNAVRSWIEDLPIANVGETARKLYKSLYDTNLLGMPHDTRLRIAEYYLSPVNYITNSLEKFYADTAFPLSERARKVALLTRAINIELCTAYKIVIRDQLLGGIDKKGFTLAVQRALAYTLRVFRQSALTYRSYPRDIWRETHMLFYHASANRLDREPIKGPGDKETATINDLYKRILLFNLSDHFRLRQRDIQQVFVNLEEWSSHSRLTTQPRMKNRKNQFVINFTRCAPPVHLSLVEKEPGKDTMILDTSMLEESLISLQNRAVLNNLTGRREALGLAEPILQHLNDVWSVVPERNYSRTQLNFELHIAMGLPAIYDLIQQAKRGETIVDYGDMFSPFEETSDPPDGLDSNFWSLAGEGPSSMTPSTLSPSTLSQVEQYSFDNHAAADTPNWTREKSHAHITVACKTINESAGGYCISWRGHNVPRVKIGELIGIRHANKKERFSLAVARWMKDEKKDLLLGVAIIAPGCRAVEARKVEGDNNPTHQCLLLPGKKDEAPPSLIIPPLAFREGNEVMVQGETGRLKIRLTGLLEGTGAFTRFSYVELEHIGDQRPLEPDEPDSEPTIELGRKINPKQDAKPEKDDSGFDTIWTVL